MKTEDERRKQREPVDAERVWALADHEPWKSLLAKQQELAREGTEDAN